MTTDPFQSTTEQSQPAAAAAQEPSLSAPLIALFKGVLYRDDKPDIWQSLLRFQAGVRDHAAVFGLELALDEAEGYAYLRQRNPQDGEEELPRLVPRRPLSYPVSLLLALLRKKLAEHDAGGGDHRLILTREQIAELMRLFLSATGDEVRLLSRIDATITKAEDLGFVRRLRERPDRVEVRRILAAFIDAQWLSEFEQRLAEYRAHAGGGGEATDGA